MTQLADTTATLAAHDSRAVIETRGLSRIIRNEAGRDATILSDVSLSVNHGEFLALTGASGSGKSSLLYLLGLLDRPSSGRLSVNGVDAAAMSDDDRARLRRNWLGFVFQFHFLLPELTVLENVALPIRRSRGLEFSRAKQIARVTLDELGLGTLVDRRPGQLSGGQQQRVAIARAVANEPLIVLADEPTGSLDSANASSVFELFAELARSRRTTVIMVTHEARFADLAARRVELRDGRVIADSSSKERFGPSAAFPPANRDVQ
jgi:lipoprotein-releasing system ATP-binding protein